MVIELDGRQFQFGDNADPDEARRLARELLEAEQELAEARTAGDDEKIKQAQRGLYWAEVDLQGYQEYTNPDRKPAEYEAPEKPPADALSPDAQAIIAALERVERATLADRVMVADEIGEFTKSRAVLSNEGEKQ